MFRSICIFGSALFLAVALAACGGDKAQENASGGEDIASKQDSATEDAVLDAATSDDEEAAEEAAEEMPQETRPKYESKNDPNAVYTSDDVKMEGSWLKINLTDLSDDQLNRVVHRSRTEYCTCGCPEDTIDECLVNDPACGTAVTLVRQIIREEKLKG